MHTYYSWFMEMKSNGRGGDKSIITTRENALLRLGILMINENAKHDVVVEHTKNLDWKLTYIVTSKDNRSYHQQQRLLMKEKNALALSKWFYFCNAKKSKTANGTVGGIYSPYLCTIISS